MTDAFRNQDWIVLSFEFVLVVLGIFLALQVDNWKTCRRRISRINRIAMAQD